MFVILGVVIFEEIRVGRVGFVGVWFVFRDFCGRVVVGVGFRWVFRRFFG